MNKIMSEVLFNRALLWLVLAYVRSGIERNRWLALVFFVPCIYNIWKSYEAWCNNE